MTGSWLTFALQVLVFLASAGYLGPRVIDRRKVTRLQSDLDAKVGELTDATHELAGLKTRVSNLESRLEDVVTDGLNKDQAITMIMRKNGALEATLKRYNALRGTCIHLDCPIDRRARKPRATKGSTP